MEALKAINLGLRFFIELTMLAALGYWGLRSGLPLPVRWLLGIGAPPSSGAHSCRPRHLYR